MSRHPLEVGFTQSVDCFEAAVDKNGDELDMRYFGVSQHGERLEHLFGQDARVDLRSVSKPIASLTLGALIDSNVEVAGQKLTLDLSAAAALDRHFPSTGAREAWRAVTIRHLVSNTIGHREGYFFRKDLASVPESEYLAYALGQPLAYTPGSHFSYSNVGPFLLSVILQDHLGVSLRDLATNQILAPLGIDAPWRNYADYTAGCTGLGLTGAELLRFGELLLAHGSLASGKSLVDPGWIAEATAPQVETPGMFDESRVFPKFGYGYAFWVCKDGVYYCDGTDGQYLVVVPAADMAIVTTGSQPDMKPITRCMVPLLTEAGRPA